MSNIESLVERKSRRRACRPAVEAAMNEMILKLHAKGFGRAEIALALADAAEDYVLRLASPKELAH
jgi:hypothetical protein